MQLSASWGVYDMLKRAVSIVPAMVGVESDKASGDGVDARSQEICRNFEDKCWHEGTDSAIVRARAGGCVAQKVYLGSEGLAASGSGVPTNVPGWREPGVGS